MECMVLMDELKEVGNNRADKSPHPPTSSRQEDVSIHTDTVRKGGRLKVPANVE